MQPLRISRKRCFRKRLGESPKTPTLQTTKQNPATLRHFDAVVTIVLWGCLDTT